MKRLFLSALLAGGICQLSAQNLIQNGDFTHVKHNALYPECGTNGGKASLFTEELTWNKCGKLEISRIIKDKNGNETASASVWIGGNTGKGGGFPVKPNTIYRFSVEIKGNALDAGIRAVEWVGGDLWKDMRPLKSTVGTIKVQKEWTSYKGTFKTTSSAKRAALVLQLWWNTKYGPQKFKVGDYILFDNVSVEEEKNTLDSIGKSSPEKQMKTTKAARSACIAKAPEIDGKLNEGAWKNAPEFRDFVLLRKKESPSAETSVKLLADRKNLYLGITCREPVKVSNSDKMNSPAIWKGDVVEIFFGPRSNDRLLSQFAIGAGGGRYSTRGGSEIRNYENWEARTSEAPGVWYAEVKIPFSELGWNNPGNGDMIAFNVCRQRKKAHEQSTWSPVIRSFHEVENFGRLVLNDYAAGLLKKYGIRADAAVDRSAFEKRAAEAESAIRKTKYDSLAKRKFSAAPVPATADFSIPFIPDEIFHPVERIRLKAAVNEYKALPLAIRRNRSLPYSTGPSDCAFLPH